ncbi:MAG TPA: OsmC family protein, partial [Pseudomonadales bacterium]|nr:OsmC family protein [Pseudomonadales bacterium]
MGEQIMTKAENPVRVSRIEKGFSFSFDVDADAMEGQKKRSLFGRFEMFCDEPVEIGGDDSAPSPLAYFAASLAFCTLTQLARVAEVRKIELKNVRMKVTPTFDQVGSIVRDDVLSRVTDVQTVLEI